MLFVGTSHGRLLKLSSDSNTLIEALQVFPYHVPVRNILVADEQIIGMYGFNYQMPIITNFCQSFKGENRLNGFIFDLRRHL